MRKSPSELTKARFSMLLVAEKMWVARPSRRVGSPEPAMVRRPETKSVPSEMSKGSYKIRLVLR